MTVEDQYQKKLVRPIIFDSHLKTNQQSNSHRFFDSKKGTLSTVAINLSIWLANLPFSVRDNVARVNVSRNFFFSSQTGMTLKCSQTLILKFLATKQIECGLPLSVPLSTTRCVITVSKCCGLARCSRCQRQRKCFFSERDQDRDTKKGEAQLQHPLKCSSL